MELIPISQNNIAQAVQTARAIFPGHVEDGVFLPGDIYVTSLHTSRFGSYFLAKDTQNILGVTGYYTCEDTPSYEERWLGWFGILPHLQQQGYGKIMLRETIKLMQADCPELKTVKLLTSCFDKEKACHVFYKTQGFEIYDQQETEPYSTYFLQKKL